MYKYSLIDKTRLKNKDKQQKRTKQQINFIFDFTSLFIHLHLNLSSFSSHRDSPLPLPGPCCIPPFNSQIHHLDPLNIPLEPKIQTRFLTFILRHICTIKERRVVHIQLGNPVRNCLLGFHQYLAQLLIQALTERAHLNHTLQNAILLGLLHQIVVPELAQDRITL